VRVLTPTRSAAPAIARRVTARRVAGRGSAQAGAGAPRFPLKYAHGRVTPCTPPPVSPGRARRSQARGFPLPRASGGRRPPLRRPRRKGQAGSSPGWCQTGTARERRSQPARLLSRSAAEVLDHRAGSTAIQQTTPRSSTSIRSGNGGGSTGRSGDGLGAGAGVGLGAGGGSRPGVGVGDGVGAVGAGVGAGVAPREPDRGSRRGWVPRSRRRRPRSARMRRARRRCARSRLPPLHRVFGSASSSARMSIAGTDRGFSEAIRRGTASSATAATATAVATSAAERAVTTAGPARGATS